MTQDDETAEVIDLSPDWDALAEYFDQRASAARKQGADECHSIWTELAARADREELTPREAYAFVGIAPTEAWVAQDQLRSLSTDEETDHD